MRDWSLEEIEAAVRPKRHKSVPKIDFPTSRVVVKASARVVASRFSLMYPFLVIVMILVDTRFLS